MKSIIAFFFGLCLSIGLTANAFISGPTGVQMTGSGCDAAGAGVLTTVGSQTVCQGALINVNANDKIISTLYFQLTKGGTAGNTFIAHDRGGVGGGSANCLFASSLADTVGGISNAEWSSNGSMPIAQYHEGAITGVWYCFTAGTFRLKVGGQSVGSNSDGTIKSNYFIMNR